eukprot:scaffold377_cov563-Prasinococcus_capsulatus_cf.AAC.33
MQPGPGPHAPHQREKPGLEPLNPPVRVVMRYFMPDVIRPWPPPVPRRRRPGRARCGSRQRA